MKQHLTMADKERFELIKASLNASVPFAAFIGVEVLVVGEERATARLPESLSLLNHIGSQHAGALYTVAEAASGAVVASAFADVLASVTPLVREGTMRYLKVARGLITADASLLGSAAALRATLARDGKVDFMVAVVLRDRKGLDVATMDAQWSIRSRRQL